MCSVEGGIMEGSKSLFIQRLLPPPSLLPALRVPQQLFPRYCTHPYRLPQAAISRIIGCRFSTLPPSATATATTSTSTSTSLSIPLSIPIHIPWTKPSATHFPRLAHASLPFPSLRLSPDSNRSQVRGDPRRPEGSRATTALHVRGPLAAS